MSARTVEVQASNGDVISCLINTSDRPPWRLTVTCGEIVERFVGDDLFECLVAWRKRLEANRAKVLCDGARLDAYPSGMAREMNGAQQVYVLDTGKPARRENLVLTFDVSPIDKIASVSAQAAYY